MSSKLLIPCVALALCCAVCHAATEYELGPDSKPQEGVPKGNVTQHRWTSSKVFPATERDYWVYVPAQYDGSQPACVMVFQDGEGFVKPDGSFHAPVVLDNLIHKKEMPVTIGVFINPGIIPAAGPNQHPRYNRSYEYDTPSDEYARFLLEEILPEVGKTYKLTNEATGRGICGSSSGGICSFTAAWERPDAFSRVICFIGSFTDLRGGNIYPSMIRKTESKPIRVFLQDGSNDLDIYSGSWFVANQDVASALKYAGYEHQFVVGDQGHNGKHGSSILPDALRFIWKDYPKLPARGTFPLAQKDGRPAVTNIVDPSEPWQLVGQGYKFADNPAPDAGGNVFFTDGPNSTIYRVDVDGKITPFVTDSKGAGGMEFGPDGRLYATQGKSKRIVAYSVPDAKEETIAEDVEGNDLTVAHDGGIYVTEHKRNQVTYISPKREKRVVDTGLKLPNGLTLTPDQGQLVVADMRTGNLYIFRVERDGSLSNRQPYFTLNVPAFATDASGDGVTVDADGRVYSTSSMGLQVCDQAGRVNAILPKPQPGRFTNVCIGGKGLDTIYVTCGDKVFRRKTKVKGVLSFQPPVLPPKPKL
jgi:sugar lactone lactonase YvrE/enterochelin esterase-like enzyme